MKKKKDKLNSNLICLNTGVHSTFHPRPQDGVFRRDLNKLTNKDLAAVIFAAIALFYSN
jgi:hypothetical protein